MPDEVSASERTLNMRLPAIFLVMRSFSAEQQKKNQQFPRKMLGALIVLILLAASSLACSFSPGEVMASNESVGGTVLFQDNFSDPNSGWDVWSNSNSLASYEQGGLRIQVNQSHFDFWSRPGKRYDQVILKVSATKLAGPDDNDYGLICRYKNRDNFYAFLISSDGYGGILKVQNGQYGLISGSNLQYSDVIKEGSSRNDLMAICSGNDLKLIVNGKQVAQAKDNELISGEVGVLAGAYGTPGVDILFNDFKAIKP
jgi:hypothetical protein